MRPFSLPLRDIGVHFVAADMPDADDFTVGIMALVAQQERETTSKHTKFGNPNEAQAVRVRQALP